MSMIWIMTIEHKYGRNVYAHRTEDGARQALWEYVSAWWEYEMGDLPMPEDHDAAIAAYFKAVEDEYFEIDNVALGD